MTRLAQEAVDLLTRPSTSTELPAVALQDRPKDGRRRVGGWTAPQSCPDCLQPVAPGPQVFQTLYTALLTYFERLNIFLLLDESHLVEQ